MSMVLTAAVCGLLLSVGTERLLQPRPRWGRPVGAWALHAGLWLLVFCVLVLLLGRPWFSCLSTLAFLLMLVLVNNAKFKALREPFLFQDYDYFTDAIRHPRLYIPFLGWGKFLGAVLGFAFAIGIGLWGETVPLDRWAWNGQLGGVSLVFLCGGLLLLLGHHTHLPVHFTPRQDLISVGYLAFLWRYYCEGRTKPQIAGPFHSLTPSTRKRHDLPHLVAVQSESFFDPRPLFKGIRSDMLAEYDHMKAVSLAYGQLQVPAWGANTVRTEFGFLSGLDSNSIGIHRFNPYRAVAAGWPLVSLASYLKRLGYRTICVHPYPAEFYLRDCVYPRLGFDEFRDISDFQESQRSGPYIGDAAVAEKIAEIVNHADGPVFVFAITMENHGPLHLEKIEANDVEGLYSEPPPDGCEDLTIYLRHLGNADRMIKTLQQQLSTCKWQGGASLCWYGDHVPIMPGVYEAFGLPTGDVEYLIWKGNQTRPTQQLDLHAHDLATHWLRIMNLID